MLITNYHVMREKLEKGEKGKRYLKCKRNIFANNLLVASEKFSDQSAFSDASYQWEGSEVLQKNIQYYFGMPDQKTTDSSQGFQFGNLRFIGFQFLLL